MKELFNVKMRASKLDEKTNRSIHISGAERISNKDSLEATVKNLVDRAINHEKGQSDSINISIDKIDKEKITYIPCVDIRTIEAKDTSEGREHIIKLLKKINIEDEKAKEILSVLDSSCHMRGAILLDIWTMKEIYYNKERGIRATGMDWENAIKEKVKEKLESHNLNNSHVREALVLASKVIYPKDVLAEICISDDPGYTTGYVNIKNEGYFRITNLKKLGSKKGGRIILFDSRHAQAEEYINFLENSITMVKTVPKIN